DQIQLRSVNACIQFLPTLDRKALFTVEDIALIRQQSAPESLHPVQQALVDHHASQCGFCTSGFVMSLWAMYENESQPPTRATVTDYLSGNLCRCTGYRPIIDAAQACMNDTSAKLDRSTLHNILRSLQHLPELHCQSPQGQQPFEDFFAPCQLERLAELRMTYPDARLLAGGTDLGLWVTKQGRVLNQIIYLGQVAALKTLDQTDAHLRIGATVSLTDALAAISQHYPALELARRFASMPIKNAGTLGGNIANGSPIGDAMPALIVLGAELVLQQGNHTRQITLEDFYLGYQKNALQQGEFLQAILLPLPIREAADAPFHSTFKFATYKIAKRYEQDISAVCAAFAVRLDAQQRIESVKIAFGGMAAIPVRATQCEAALHGQPWSAETIQSASLALAQDYQPLSDGRASAAYRLRVAQNCLQRFFLEQQSSLAPTRLVDLIATVGV
ncbi:MAG: xanthine dehydrogenase small subunit, partial [Pseudomonadota bacterium]|nr:xanthine dehydrogenase small subunit [Pseudomonadota bacterium]